MTQTSELAEAAAPTQAPGRSQAVEPRSPRFIGRQLALGFGSVSAVAIFMCAMLVWVIQDVSGLVDSMRHDETSISQGMELSASVREMSIQVALTIIDPDESHTEEYELARNRVRSTLQTLAARVPSEQRARLVQLGETTQAMHELLTTRLLPAVRRGDIDAARETHRQLAQLGAEASKKADILAAATTQQMAHAHDHATSSTRVGLFGGGLCAVLIVVLSIVFTLRLRSVVLRPLHALADAALRYGKGDFAFRAGDVGKGELAVVGDAFSRMADELARRESQLLRTERMAAIGQLAAGIAHELNNPIGIIRGYLKTMSPEEDPETLREELSILDEEAAQCQRIAEDLLSYARADELTFERLEIEAFLIETAKRYRVGPGAAQVEVDVQDARVEADGTRLRQVVLNLLNNAGQVSAAGGSVQVFGAVRGESYQVEVVDQGPGIQGVDMDRIFEPFFSKRKGGSGLGLAVCQGIVRAHHGTIEVEHDARRGTVFRITIPLKRALGQSLPEPEGSPA